MPKQGRSRARRRSPDPRRGVSAHALATPAKRGFQGLAALLGLLLIVTQLVDWLERRGAPDSAMAAQFEDLGVRKGETLREFRRRTQTSPPQYAGHDPDERGAGMRVRVKVRGFAGTRIAVRWTLHDRTTGRPVPGATWSRIVARPRPRHDVYVEVMYCWVPPPARPGRYYVRFTIETAGGRIRGETSTPTLVVRRGEIRR